VIILPPAIVLGADSPIGLTVIRELGRHGVPVHAIGSSADALGAQSRYCTSSSVRPAGDMADWLPPLIASTGARALLAVSENDLRALAALPAEIGDCAILTPRAAQLDLVLDKRRTLDAAQAVGIDVPSSWQPVATDDFAACAAALSYPVIAKWADTSAIAPRLEALGLEFVKAEYARSADELCALLDRYRPLSEWPLVQSYAPGLGLGQMLFMHEGVATLQFQHRRLREWPPEGGVSTLCAAEPQELHAAQMAKSEALLAAIGWQGPAMVEYRYDPATGRYCLMEINGRFWGSLPLAAHCGAAFAWESYRRALLPQDASPQQPKAGLRARYVVPDTRRLARVLFGRQLLTDPACQPGRLATLFRYIADFFDPRVRYYVGSLDDPRPLGSDLIKMLRKAFRG
jgi:predicted ATP-grasp superfamily ATP-dependent carboligase